MKRILLVTITLLLAISVSSESKHPVITISVADVTTGQSIADGDTILARDTIQVTVTTNGVDCAGQVAITALGTTGAPPEVGVVSAPFTIGPATSESFSTFQFQAGTLANGTNDWKISASCNGAHVGQFSFARIEFFENVTG
jgi:hypothetical protein